MRHQFSCQYVEYRYVIDTIMDAALAAIAVGLAACIWVAVGAALYVTWKNRK